MVGFTDVAQAPSALELVFEGWLKKSDPAGKHWARR
jgi:hypothetical protein